MIQSVENISTKFNYPKFNKKFDVLNLHKATVLKKTTIAILKYHCVKDGRLYSTNLSQSISSATTLEDGMYSFVGKNLLRNYLHEIKDFPYIFSEIVGEKIAEFEFQNAPALFNSALVNCDMNKDELRSYLETVCFDFENITLCLVATNGHLLRRIDITEKVNLTEEFSGKVIIPREAIKILLNDNRPEKIRVTYYQNDDKYFCTIATDDYIITSACFDPATYPKYLRVIPGKYPKQLRINRNEILSAITVLTKLSGKKFKDLVVGISETGSIFCLTDSYADTPTEYHIQLETFETEDKEYINSEHTPIQLIMQFKVEVADKLLAYQGHYLSDILKTVHSENVIILYSEDLCAPTQIIPDNPFLWKH